MDCWFICFHSSTKLAFLPSKGLVCLYDKQNNTWLLVDMEFLFSCLTRHLTCSLRSLVSYQVKRSKRNSISTCAHILFSISSKNAIWNIRYQYLQMKIWTIWDHHLRNSDLYHLTHASIGHFKWAIKEGYQGSTITYRTSYSCLFSAWSRLSLVFSLCLMAPFWAQPPITSSIGTYGKSYFNCCFTCSEGYCL